MSIDEKIEESITLLRKGEKVAIALNPQEGFFVGFSGGKDSQVLLELVKMAGVRHHAYYSVTTNDPPENVRFIRENYPEVTFIHPDRKDTFLKLVERKGLPTMDRRFCCDIPKEKHGAGSVVLDGVRAEESRKRSTYEEVMVLSRRKEHADRHKVTIEGIMQNEHQCIKGKDKLVIHPLLHWTKDEVWEFIHEKGLRVNPCYEHSGRVGCMFCPYASKKQINQYEQMWPKYKDKLIRALHRYWEKTDEHFFDTPEEYYEWWKSKKSVKQYKEQHY